MQLPISGDVTEQISLLQPIAYVIGMAVSAWIGYLAARKTAKVQEALTTTERELSFDEVVTRRVKILIDGYENRISDLTLEVHSLRSDVKSLRIALMARMQECQDCPHLALWHQRVNELMTLERDTDDVRREPKRSPA